MLDIPDDLAERVERLGKRSGRATADELVRLIELALVLESLPPAGLPLRAIAETREDAETGLPVLLSPPDAPIHAMTAGEALRLEQSLLDEQDLRRAGIPL